MGHYMDHIDRVEANEKKREVERVKKTASVLEEVREELVRARTIHPKGMNSAHEGYAVLKEEIDELWEEVRKKSSKERTAAMREEAIQVAAMCVRFIEDVCDN